MLMKGGHGRGGLVVVVVEEEEDAMLIAWWWSFGRVLYGFEDCGMCDLVF